MMRRGVDCGTTAVEYGLVLSLVPVAALPAVTAVGENTEATYDSIAGVLGV